MKEVTPLRYPYCQKILPLVYDESLSYYEALCKFVTKVNELVDALNDVKIDILDEAKAYTDTKVAQSLVEVDIRIQTLNQLIAQTEAEFQQKINALQSQYSAFTNEVNGQLLIMNNKVGTLDTKIDNAVIGVNARTDLAIQQNNDYIFEVIGSQVLGNIKVRNFFTGQMVAIQDMFDYLAGLHVSDGLTYSQIATRNKTVNQMIAYNQDITDFILHANTIIV